MSRRRIPVWIIAALLSSVALVSASAVSVAASATTAAAKKHHKRGHHKPKHHKPKHHTKTPPKSTKQKLEECSTTVSGTGGPAAGTSYYSYQVILGCGKGEFGSFEVSTNRTIEAGSISAHLGSRYTYTCQQTSSTSFSCSGVSAQIPPGESGALRAFFKSPQAPCLAGAPESATVTTQGETFNATVGESQGAC